MIGKGAILLMLALLGYTQVTRVQAQKCGGEDAGRMVRSVTVEARWLPNLSLPLKRGEEFTSEKLSATREAVRKKINAELDKSKAEFVNLGMTPIVELKFIWACVREVSPATCQAEGLTDKCVDVVIHPYTLNIDTISVGSNMLPIPRFNKFSVLSNVPPPLHILNPKFGLAYDRELGITPNLELSTDLISLPKLLEHESAGPGKTALLLRAKGSKSITEPFYTTQIGLLLLFRQPIKQIESIGIETKFTGDQEPQKEARYLKNSFRLGGHVNFNPSWGVVNRILLGAAYRRSNNRLGLLGVQPVIRTDENLYEGRSILEGRILNGFTRLGLWLDGGKPVSVGKGYNRQAGLLGYEKEIPIAGHTIGVEILLGAGRASARTPEYARFFGGNPPKNFLFDDVSDPALTSLPSGPLLRSFGNNQAGATIGGSLQRGANSYQHFNLTISIPIPGLSRPLIPDEIVDVSPTGDKLTLRKLVKNATDTGQELLSLHFQEEGFEEDVANKKAGEIFKEVRPGVNYLTDYAKIYAIRPLLMFDEARLQRTGRIGSQNRYAVGGGLQLTLLVAKFEAGYLRTIHRFQGDQRGAFIARLTFLNIF